MMPLRVGILGKGGYGAVHLLCEKYTNKNYAIKVCNKFLNAYIIGEMWVTSPMQAIPLKENSFMSQMVKRECMILQRMNHENVVSLKYTFIANNQIYLAMSYHSCGNLKQVIDRDSPAPEHLMVSYEVVPSAVMHI